MTDTVQVWLPVTEFVVALAAIVSLVLQARPETRSAGRNSALWVGLALIVLPRRLLLAWMTGGAVDSFVWINVVARCSSWPIAVTIGSSLLRKGRCV